LPSDPGVSGISPGGHSIRGDPGKARSARRVRVLEVATRIFGPATADYLGLFGAEVIKVEMPPRGDLMRYVAPEGFFWKEMSPAFLSLNRNKLHVGLDLHPAEGRSSSCGSRNDPMSSWRISAPARWTRGCRYLQLRERNPRIVYAANSGFGQWGRSRRAGVVRRHRPGRLRFLRRHGFPDQPPMKAGSGRGLHRGVDVRHRDPRGSRRAPEDREGQMIDLSQAEAMIRTLDWTWPYAGLTERTARNGNVDPSYPPSGIYRCRDGFVAVSARTRTS